MYDQMFLSSVPQWHYCWQAPLSLLILCILHKHLWARRMLNLNCTWQESNSIEKCSEKLQMHCIFSGPASPMTIIITQHLISVAMLKPDGLVRCHGDKFQTDSRQSKGFRTDESVLVLKAEPGLSRAVRFRLYWQIVLLLLLIILFLRFVRTFILCLL